MILRLPHTKDIDAEINRLFLLAENQFPAIFSIDAYFKRLADYSVRGKMVRSNLVIISWLGYQPAKTRLSQAVLTLAAIQEISESGILIQDDVVDDDQHRRGQPSMHLQFESLASETQPNITAHNAKKFGESWALMLGDHLYFFLFELLSELPTSDVIRLQLIRLYGQQLGVTVTGQLGDLAAGFGVVEPTIDEIMEITRQKTAHYTICLPLLAGAVLAGQSEEELKKIEAVGEVIGQIFQITDDRLDLFSTTETSGKTQGSDVKTGKRTLQYFYTLELLQNEPEKLTEFLRLYGTPELTQDQLERVQQLVKESGAFDKIETHLRQLAEQARHQLADLAIGAVAHQQLLVLLDFLLTRDH
ncbi:polyprenyl synthetase family protein [Candidatus Woesebacteria bacterium]|nr:polyprenyl synthetase family protein [Candidatus Woesebacteria bacterium]